MLFATSASAQFVREQHRCWDISTDVEMGENHVQVPMMTTVVDSGAMLVAMAHQYLGVPYHYAGRSPKAFDCTGFALYLYKHFGYDLPGWSGAQAKLGVEV